MNVHLLYPDHPFDFQASAPWQTENLAADLCLSPLFDAMAGGDEFLREIAEKVIVRSNEGDEQVIGYRQGILRDCVRHPELVRGLHSIACEAVDAARRQYRGLLPHSPGWVLRSAEDHLRDLLPILRRLNAFAARHAGKFSSAGWTALFLCLTDELDREYLEEVEGHLDRLRFRDGMLLSAAPGPGNKGTDYLLHLSPAPRLSWLQRLFRRLRALFATAPPPNSFSVDPRDESGARALDELRSRGVAPTARVLGQSRDHVHNFFSTLRAETGFYVGCLNLRDRLLAKGEPVAFPATAPVERRVLSFRGLYDAGLSLKMGGRRMVGNDVSADGSVLLLVTGANQGGKSTFLRSLGAAQLLMQAGMFVPAQSFSASVCRGIFSHYKREEDAALESGKLDEELGRMSAMVDRMTSGALFLSNESFSVTTEREASEIARQIMTALADRAVRVVCVTHLYAFAASLHDAGRRDFHFLRAERSGDGVRTFRLVPGAPQRTSYGKDLFQAIFAGEEP
jgi:hypothetical protein